jgi:hypothetical protein
MSKIFELFGHRLDRWDEAAERNLQDAGCPFMDAECDGGGNRYQSAISLSNKPALKEKIPNKEIIQCGVCSMQMHEGEQPWIICPRRLLSVKHGNLSAYQAAVRSRLSSLAGLIESVDYLVWSEIKMKAAIATGDDEAKNFDYTFDYVISGASRMRLEDAAAVLEMTIPDTKKLIQRNNYTLALREGDIWIENFPVDPIIIIEVMTSSTSGGNKDKRTQIAMACEDAILNGMNHTGPGINYRQVWARMVSQLIVKSQVGMAWGAKTVWLVQDVLADYISQSTALLLSEYLSEHLDEVNILAFGYGGSIDEANSSIVELKQSSLYSGPISRGNADNLPDGFVDIVKIGATPPENQIWKSLAGKAPLGFWQW